jgi:membrane-associated phospholipid phosphatase
MKKIFEFIKKNYLLIIGVICVIFVILILEDVFENDIMKIDVAAYNIFINQLRNDNLTIFMKCMTNCGSAVVLIIITILSYIFLQNKKITQAITINLITITIINILLKNIVQRPRPIGYRLINESGYSFPSGHSMISMAFYGFIIYLIYSYVKNPKLKWFLCFIISLLIIFIGISRIYLGVHYASDVIAGLLISIDYLIIYIKATKNKLN